MSEDNDLMGCYKCQECRQTFPGEQMAVIRPVSKCLDCVQAHEMVLANNPFDTDTGRYLLKFD